jgi:hypothetical protein
MSRIFLFDQDAVKIINEINNSLVKINNFKKGIEYYRDEDGYREYYEVPVDLYLNLFAQVYSQSIKFFGPGKRLWRVDRASSIDEGKETNDFPMIRYLYQRCVENFNISVPITPLTLSIRKTLCYVNGIRIKIRERKDGKKVFIKEGMNKLSKYILEYMKDNESYFMPIFVDLDFKSHINAIFVERDSDTLYLSWYEPHGSEKKDEKWYSFSRNFLRRLSKYSETKIEYKINVGPEKGVQNITEKDDIGFCIVFSYYWLYCCLNVALYKRYVKKVKENSFEWIQTIETYNTKIKNPYIIAVSFCNFMFDIFMSEFSDKKNIIMEISRMFDNYIKEFKLVKKVKLTDKKEEIKEEKELESYDKIPISETMEYKEYKSKKKCSNSMDCSSDCCKDGFCVLGKECGKGQEDIVMYE